MGPTNTEKIMPKTNGGEKLKNETEEWDPTVVWIEAIPQPDGKQFYYIDKWYKNMEDINLKPGMYVGNGGSGSVFFEVSKNGEIFFPYDKEEDDEFLDKFIKEHGIK